MLEDHQIGGEWEYDGEDTITRMNDDGSKSIITEIHCEDMGTYYTLQRQTDTGRFNIRITDEDECTWDSDHDTVESAMTHSRKWDNEPPKPIWNGLGYYNKSNPTATAD